MSRRRPQPGNGSHMDEVFFHTREKRHYRSRVIGWSGKESWPRSRQFGRTQLISISRRTPMMGRSSRPCQVAGPATKIDAELNSPEERNRSHPPPFCATVGREQAGVGVKERGLHRKANRTR